MGDESSDDWVVSDLNESNGDSISERGESPTGTIVTTASRLRSNENRRLVVSGDGGPLAEEERLENIVVCVRDSCELSRKHRKTGVLCYMWSVSASENAER